MADVIIPKGMCSVYWLFDDKCVCLWRHGYVGITGKLLSKRIVQHRRINKRLPKVFDGKVLFIGSRKQCLELEGTLRSDWFVGWNVSPGGFKSGGSIAPKSLEHREKIRAAALLRYSDPKERKRTAIIVKKAFENIDRSGSNNGHYGKPLSEEGKRNISVGRKGKAIGNQNWRKRKRYSAELRQIMSEASKRRWAKEKELPS